jgi:membrane associated rhomboid family serine protease
MIPLTDNIRPRHRPIATQILIGLNVLVFLYEMVLSDSQLTALFYLHGVVPLRLTHPDFAARHGFPDGAAWTLLTSMFLHGGFIHILSNVWILWVFGDNVEDRMGSVRFTVFYLLCGALSMVCHTLTNWNSAIPAIGASGAIAGVLGAYFVMFPRSMVLTLVPLFIIPVIPVPAYFFLVFWFLSQLFNGTLSLASGNAGEGIAWWAHIGGFTAGMYVYRFFLSRARQAEVARRTPTPASLNR